MQNDIRDGTGDAAAEPGSANRRVLRRVRFVGANASLILFMVVYCARPEDWIPGLTVIPLAKIAGILAVLALALSWGDLRWPLPREVNYLILLIGQLFLAVPMALWPGGAFQQTVDFAKVGSIVIVMISAVNTVERLRRFLFIQGACAAVVAAVTLWKGHLIFGRLEGVLASYYADPNDLALIISISLPFCLASLFLTKRWLSKACWSVAMLVMSYVVFLTGSRGGFLTLFITAAVCVWEFGIKGHRHFLLVAAALAGLVLWLSSGGLIGGRLKATFNGENGKDVAAAYGSAEARQQLFWRSIEITRKHPLFGVGPGNFQIVSGSWHESHNTFTSMSAEGGLPALALYSLILWAGFKNVKTAKRLSRGKRDLRILTAALRASLTGYVAGSSFLSVGYVFFPYFLVAYTTVLARIAKNSDYSRPRSRGETQVTVAGRPYSVATAPNAFV
jgi:putative inorganic carbon (HCO3(-)) transporter